MATALVDTRSDASFINAKFALKAKCQTVPLSKVQVAAADGQMMFSEQLAWAANKL